MTLTLEPGVRDARALLNPDDFMAVTATVAKDNPDMGWTMAERVVVEGLKFVAVAADGTERGIAPSRVVDEGWHALILHTAIYKGLCERLGGFVHHYPEPPDSGRYDPEFIDRTMAAIEAAGFPVDQELWRGPDNGIVEVSASCQHAPNCGPIQPMPTPQCLPDPPPPAPSAQQTA
ncbi:glycine-rich domain-containing protein [Streptomyces sp. NPDC096136]|uniref:glycine-rich domain-containing protein n=1 Tax=Streptomyces sp. NPDC096136 TaxID=3366076 RepID=UPI0037F60D46